MRQNSGTDRPGPSRRTLSRQPPKNHATTSHHSPSADRSRSCGCLFTSPACPNRRDPAKQGALLVPHHEWSDERRRARYRRGDTVVLRWTRTPQRLRRRHPLRRSQPPRAPRLAVKPGIHAEITARKNPRCAVPRRTGSPRTVKSTVASAIPSYTCALSTAQGQRVASSCFPVDATVQRSNGCAARVASTRTPRRHPPAGLATPGRLGQREGSTRGSSAGAQWPPRRPPPSPGT